MRAMDKAIVAVLAAATLGACSSRPDGSGFLGGPQTYAVMVQSEVADRITAKENCKSYGILTVKLKYWWRVVDRFEVAAKLFRPPPKVDAAVLVFEPTEPESRPSADLWPELSRLIDLAFNQRRKKLYNSPAASFQPAGRESPVGRKPIQDALDRMNLDVGVRAENLTSDHYIRLAGLLAEKG